MQIFIYCFAVNKYLHTVASFVFIITLNYEARNHELKKNYYYVLTPFHSVARLINKIGPVL